MDKSKMRDELTRLRGEWRAVRGARLSRRDELISEGNDAAAVRRDRAYRALKKKQKQAAKLIRHYEKKLNRKSAFEKE